MKTSRSALLLGFMSVAILSAASAGAQSFPVRPVRFILPSGPGGGTEIVTRMIAQKLTVRWGQPAIVENRPGGNGLVAVQALKSLPADGHSLLLVNPFIGANAALFGKLPYDYKADFQPVAVAFHNYFYFVARSGSALDSVQNVIRTARAQPGGLNYGAPISSISQRLWMEVFNRQLGLSMVFVGYKSAGATVQALAAGDIQLMNVGLPAIEGMVRQGKVKILAVGAPRRAAVTPDVPTVDEVAGTRGFVSDSWVGYVTHAQAPSAAVRDLHSAILAALREPELVAFFRQNDYSIMDLSPPEFGRLIDADTERYTRYINELKLKPE